ncbi:hypothetical protein GCM10011506_11660 [Marivirga lumbricoides]|uniref:Outer membrane protein beta-barrel domain-containing protein n=1 Tax=Marivirga lumbricoides TaxID=1046115 RepID=A0ABQ1LTK6_9BACT|nr:hypothetical protein GCM10011506_11660 [Marivirga lumbricoides]
MTRKISNVKVLSVAFILCFAALQNAYAQKPKEEDNACVLNLERANEMYREGKIDLIIDQLLPCLNGTRLNKENKVRAYRLLVITQLYFNERDAAADYMVELLKLEPEYEINENLDPTEFIQLYNRFRTYPILLVGLHAGGNYSFPTVHRNFSLDNTSTSLGSYTPEMGYSVGISLEIPFFNKWSVLTNINYLYNKFEYDKKQYNYSEVIYLEEQSWMEIPVEIKYYINEGDFRLYAQAGASVQYLLDASASITRLDSLNEELGNQTVAGPSVNMKDHRMPFNLSAKGAIGFTWKGVIGNGYLLGSISYTYGLNDVNNPKERYSNSELLYDYNYVDNDFSMNNLSIKVGYALPIYKPKLMDRNKRKKQK